MPRCVETRISVRKNIPLQQLKTYYSTRQRKFPYHIVDWDNDMISWGIEICLESPLFHLNIELGLVAPQNWWSCSIFFKSFKILKRNENTLGIRSMYISIHCQRGSSSSGKLTYGIRTYYFWPFDFNQGYFNQFEVLESQKWPLVDKTKSFYIKVSLIFPIPNSFIVKKWFTLCSIFCF